MSNYRVPFSRLGYPAKALEYVDDSACQGRISADGPYNQKCERLLEQTLNVPRVLLTTSGSHALEMAALLLNIQPGDEVIVPSFTFVSVVNAFALRGARPVFIDIRPDTLNMDETKLESLVTRRTKAILPMHYAGVGCEMDSILEIAERHDIAVVEDNALGLFGKYKGKYLGTLGCFGMLSFNERKSFTCGEGGALLINDPQYIERAEVIREKGTNRALFLKGKVDKYTWIDIGSSYLLSDILAAFLYAQLEAREGVRASRLLTWKYYFRHLRDWAQHHNVKLPFIPDHCEQSYDLFYMLVNSLLERQALMESLKSRGIQTAFHYLPLHLSPMGRKFGGRPGDCPVTERITDCLVRLPFYNDMTEQDQALVVASLSNTKLTAIPTEISAPL